MPSPRFTLVLLAPLVLALLSACSQGKGADNKDEKTPAARAVLAEPVRFAAHPSVRTFVGTIKPRIESDFGFRVAGKMADRRVILGQKVSAGDILATIDPVDLNLQREQAEAELSAATVSLDQASRQNERNLELRRKGWTTDAVVQQQEAATAEAKSRLDRAKRSLELANNQLAYAELKADADGVVTAILAEPGQVVAAGTPIVRVARTRELEAQVDIPETLIAKVRAGKASVALWSNPDRVYQAHLREFAAAADAATRTFAARFVIDDADQAMSFGMTATLTISEADAAPLARLPIAAVLDQGNGPSVFVIDPKDSTLVNRPVAVKGYDGANVLIQSGLADGDVVVLQGVHKLLPGERVRIVADRG